MRTPSLQTLIDFREAPDGKVFTNLRSSGERTRPRVPFPASRRKTLFGETPKHHTRDAYAPQRMPSFFTRGISCYSEAAPGAGSPLDGGDPVATNTG